MLDLDFNTNTKNSSYQYPEIDTSTVIPRLKKYGNTLDKRMHFGIHPTFRSYGNSPQIQKYSSVSFVWSISNNYDESINSSSINEQVSDQSKLNNLSFLILDNRRFYNSRKQFIKIGSIIDWDRYSDQSIDFGKQITEATFQDYKRNVKNKRSELELELSVGVGKGRIEEVQDSRQAIYIFEELSANGILQRNFTQDDILDFAKKLSNTKRQRFLDSRNRWKYITTEIDSFLTENNFCAKSNNIEYYNTLWEFLNYGSMFSRTAGQRIEFNFSPKYIQKNRDQEVTINSLIDNNDNPIYMQQDSSYTHNKYSSINHLLFLTFDFNYSLAKPINLNWQYNLNTTINGGIIYGNSNTKQDNVRSSIIFINDLPNATINDESTDSLLTKLQNGILEMLINQNISWYPNTRTNCSAFVNLGYLQLFPFESDNDVKTYAYQGFNGQSGFSLTYFISPKLTVSSTFSLYFEINKSPNEFRYMTDQNDYEIIYNTTNAYDLYGNISNGFYKNNFASSFDISFSYSIF